MIKSIVAAGVVALSLFFMGLGMSQKDSGPVDTGSSWSDVRDPGERIEEDDPRWDCRTMGNKVCGPGAS